MDLMCLHREQLSRGGREYVGIPWPFCYPYLSLRCSSSFYIVFLTHWRQLTKSWLGTRKLCIIQRRKLGGHDGLFIAWKQYWYDLFLPAFCNFYNSLYYLSSELTSAKTCSIIYKGNVAQQFWYKPDGCIWYVTKRSLSTIPAFVGWEIWSRVNCLDNCWMDCDEIWYRH